MPKLELTDDVLRGAVRGDTYTDTVCRGLTARAGAGGVTFSLRFVRDGKQGAVSLGDWPRMSIAQARAHAQMERGRVRDGEVPLAVLDRQARREKAAPKAAVPTLADVWDAYMREHLASARKDKGMALDRIVSKDIGKLATVAVDVLTREMAHEKVDAIIARGATSMAKHFRDAISAAWEHGRRLGRYDAPDPFADVRKVGRRDRLASAPKTERFRTAEWKAWLAWLPESDLSSTMQRLLMLQALTGTRSGELCEARRDQIEWNDNGTGWLRMTFKRAARNIYLSKQAARIVRELLDGHDSPWLFPSVSAAGHVLQPAIVWAIVQVRAKCPVKAWCPTTNAHVDWSSHTIRRSVKAGLTRELRVDHVVSELVLGHSLGQGVRAAYDHATDWEPQIADALDRWGALLDSWRGVKLKRVA